MSYRPDSTMSFGPPLKEREKYKDELSVELGNWAIEQS
jgi:hypothetical protein